MEPQDGKLRLELDSSNWAGALQEDLRKIAERVAQAMRAFSQFVRELPNDVRRLADLGWTVPLEFTPGETLEVARGAHNRAEADEIFFRFFTDDAGRMFEALRRDLLSEQSLDPWRPLLAECFEAYDRGQFSITIPALLSIIEGYLAQLSNTLKRRTRVPDITAAAVALKGDGIDALLWESVHQFVSNLFAYYDFAGQPPPVINRHWILHGRYCPPWSQIDSLRLFNALHTITAVASRGSNSRGSTNADSVKTNGINGG